MPVACKTYLTEITANTAITLALATWQAPSYADVGDGRHVPWASLPPQQMTGAPILLASGRFAVVANHPTFVGEVLNIGDIVSPVLPGLGAQALGLEAKGADSGIVARPGAGEERTG